MRDLPGLPALPALPALPKVRAGIETYIVPDGSCFLYDPASDASYILDQIGALVWDYCDGATAAETMISEITTLMPGDEGIAARVTSLLTEFASERLLEASHIAASQGELGASDQRADTHHE